MLSIPCIILLRISLQDILSRFFLCSKLSLLLLDKRVQFHSLRNDLPNNIYTGECSIRVFIHNKANVLLEYTDFLLNIHSIARAINKAISCSAFLGAEAFQKSLPT